MMIYLLVYAAGGVLCSLGSLHLVQRPDYAAEYAHPVATAVLAGLLWPVLVPAMAVLFLFFLVRDL